MQQQHASHPGRWRGIGPGSRTARQFLLHYLVLCAASTAAAGDAIALTDEMGRPPLPIQTRIAVDADDATRVEARVTLVFPHSGFEVVDWGAPVLAENHFSVEVKITSDPIALPVVSEATHAYALGHLVLGDYTFEVTSLGDRLGIVRFRVSDEPRPPASAGLRVRVLDDRRAMARVRVVFHQPGYRIGDWGFAEHDGDREFTIRARAEQLADGVESRDQVLEEQHTYRLADDPLPPGAYRVRFLLNGHPLAKADFTVDEFAGVVQRHDEQPLTEPGRPTHPIRVRFEHPSGIDPGTLGDDDIRVVGPNGYDRFATLATWEPSAAGGVVATYLAHAPGSTWTARDNGSYGVSLVADSVRAGSGYLFPAWRLGVLRVEIPDTPPPWIECRSIEILEPDTATPAGGPVGYGARVTLLVGSSNVLVHWGEAAPAGNRIRVEVTAYYDGLVGLPVITERSHTYSLGSLAPGHYHFVVWAHGQVIGEQRFTVEPVPPVTPRAEVVAGDITQPSPDPHVFQIRFDPDIDVESVRRARIRVDGPDGYEREARLLALETGRPTVQAVTTFATYEVAAPSHGWAPRHNGFYGIYLPHRTITDFAGTFVPGGLAGGFDVMIRPVPEPGKPRLGFHTEVDATGQVVAHLKFHPGDSQWRVMRWGEHVRVVGLTFVAKAEIHEHAMPPYGPQEKTYVLGRLKPGLYGFVWHGSNGFASRHLFRVGAAVDSAAPYECWQQASAELAARRGDAPPDTSGQASLHAYAFALDAGQPPPAGVVRTSLESGEDGGTRLLIVHPVVPLATDIVYRIEVSGNLLEWEDATGLVDERGLHETPDGTCLRIIGLPGPFMEGAGGNRLFTRVRADHAPPLESP